LYRGTEIIKDSGSGFDSKRKGFISLLNQIYFGGIEEIIVLYKDRLCRFGFDLLEFICKKAACRIMVYNTANSNEQDVTQKLSENLLFIVIVFVARNNELRVGRKKKNMTKTQRKPRKSRNQQENAIRSCCTPMSLRE
jgi:predicted site-specific integrase-resolvase